MKLPLKQNLFHTIHGNLACQPLLVGFVNTFPVEKLCHGTHRRNAEQIAVTSADDYIFQAKRRTGKCGQYVVDGSPLGESYKCNLNQAIPDEDTRYQYVSEDQSLLPEGKYSWWAIRALVDMSTDGCRYGGHVFTASFPYMLGQFRLAHAKGKKTPEIFFKKAGTLRYKRRSAMLYLYVLTQISLGKSEICHQSPKKTIKLSVSMACLIQRARSLIQRRK